MAFRLLARVTAAAMVAMPVAALGQGSSVAPVPFVATAAMVDKGDVAWMLMSSALVLMMSVPGLALFYGGLVRARNMLSVLMQVLAIVCVAALVWVGWGYSLAFTSTGSPFPALIGGLDKAMFAGVTPASLAATFSNGVYLPEYVFALFQMTFACIAPAIIVGAFAERVRFGPLLLFTVLWITFAYLPIAHMVWYWAGPDFLSAAPDDAGLLWAWGALDYAGGTVVHISAGIAGLVGCLVIGPRLGFGREAMPPHNLAMVMIGASLLWVGWIGFNAGSGLEANGIAALAAFNTLVAAAGAGMAWTAIEYALHRRASFLGAATGVVAGLVAITPAAGFAAPGPAILLGAVGAAACFLFITTVKSRLGYDDSLDAFGVHAVAGIVGAIGTGVVASPALGGQGWVDYTAAVARPGDYAMGAQVMTQLWAVAVTIAWSGAVSAVLFAGLNRFPGLRVDDQAEREGLDLSQHGERAYNS